MFCRKCGKELSEGAAFCSGCGTPVGTDVRQEIREEVPSEVKTVKNEDAGKKEKAKFPIGIVVAIGAVVLLAAIGLGAFFLIKGRNAEAIGSDDEEERITQETDQAVVAGAEVNWQELEPLYSIEDVGTIDIYAQNYTPAAKTPGAAWDSTLFYWLEDIDQTSTEDGYLAKCRITKTLLRNAENGNLIQYEIYRDPNTSEIYKIVSIEAQENGLKLCDYYYQNGKLNFIFVRDDSVYTPTYATPDKVGERYYFAEDTMVRWRLIREPRVIEEYVLAPTEVSYVQVDYFSTDEGGELRSLYDGAEQRMLNAAYNTYNAVSAQSGIGFVDGCVKDTAGTPVAGLTVDVLRTADDVLMYRGTTEEDGSFRILTYLDNTECYIIIRGNDLFKETNLYGVFLTEGNLSNSYSNLVMHRVSGDEYQVHINVYSATDVRSNEDGTITQTLLPGAAVSIREGAGAYEGTVLQTLQADEGGQLNTSLPSGTYTAQIEVPGYAAAYLEIEVMEQETTASSYVLPAISEDKTGIVLTWDGTATDLDLTLFTPYQSTGGDMAHIGGAVLDDGHGNQLIADNTAGCEVMYINTAELGSYKLYVNDYTDSMTGSYTSDILSTLNVHIYIYDNTGFVTEYTFPAGQSGVVWEVVELSGKQLTPSQRVYSQLEGKSWWLTSKKELNLDECEELRKLLNAMVDGWSVEKLSVGNWEQAGSHICILAFEKHSAYMDALIENARENADVINAIDQYNLENYGGTSEDYFNYLALTESELEYIMYSMTGEEWNINSLSDTGYDIWGDYAVFEVFAYGDVHFSLRNFETEYLGNNTWRITAESYYIAGLGIPEYKHADVSFTVIRNLDSCFDGYSVVDINSKEVDNTEWAQAYYDYIINSEYASEMDGQWDLDSATFGQRFYLLYVDDDSIPEIYVEGTSYASGDQLLTYSGGQVREFYFDNYGGEYIPGSGLLHNSGGHMGAWWNEVYQLVNGELQTVAYGRGDCLDENGFEVFDENGDEIVQHVQWNGQDVTEEQYSICLQEVFDTTQAESCYGDYGEYSVHSMGDVDFALEILKYNIQ